MNTRRCLMFEKFSTCSLWRGPGLRPVFAIGMLVFFLCLAAIGLAQGPEPIRIGSVFANTGAGAEENSPNYRMVILAAKNINAQGGLLGRPVEVVEFDTKSSPLGARQAALDAVAAKVVAVIGPSLPRTGSESRSKTTARAWSRRSVAASSSLSSPPNRPARARDWGFRCPIS